MEFFCLSYSKESSLKTIKSIIDLLSTFLPLGCIIVFPFLYMDAGFLGADKKYDYLREMVVWLIMKGLWSNFAN